jgi:histidinol-phosphate aminotransferase
MLSMTTPPSGTNLLRGRLHLNEHPLPPLPSVTAAITDALTRAHQYPAFHPEALAATLAQWCGVHQDQVIVGNGSVGVALQLLRAVQRPGHQLVYAWRNFDAYPLLAQMTQAEPVPVPLRPGGHQDLSRLLAATTLRTSAVILCNPHNPTGTLLRAADLEDFLTHLPTRTLLILDEAYTEFASDHAPPTTALLARHPNLVLLRTFSKAYGLAGLRIGYGLAHPDTTGAARVHQLPFGITAAASAAVHASLQAQRELHTRIHTITRTRDQLHQALLTRGWSIPRSYANFLWLDQPHTCHSAHQALENAGIHTRLYPGEGLRLTVPDPQTVPAVLHALSSTHP